MFGTAARAVRCIKDPGFPLCSMSVLPSASVLLCLGRRRAASGNSGSGHSEQAVGARGCTPGCNCKGFRSGGPILCCLCLSVIELGSVLELEGDLKQ